MESSEDKQWATKYLLDPLSAPEPSDETGPGTHFNSTMARAPSSPQTQTPAMRKSSAKSAVSSVYPTPPASASPSRSSFHPSNPYSPVASPRQATFSERSPVGTSNTHQVENNGKSTAGRRRASSLVERYPGDMSHRPLDVIRKDTKAANRAPHLRKKHMPGADTIDSLDKSVFGALYHHEGPYDATLLARNTSYKNSPVEATRSTNEEAIRATPKELIVDSLRKHVPLQGVAVIPPGMNGPDGRPMQYEEGADLMREPDAPGGAYKRWDGIKYLPEDYKGKGEPSFSIEKQLKEHDQARNPHRRVASDGTQSYEMMTPRSRLNRQRSSSINGELNPNRGPSTSLKYVNFESDMRRSNSLGASKLGDGLKKRFGSLRRGKKTQAQTTDM